MIPPLDLHELFEQRLNGSDHPAITDHWYWCRRHKVPEHVSKTELVMCKRIGPFMSEREANRLGDDEYSAPLGMEVEG